MAGRAAGRGAAAGAARGAGAGAPPPALALLPREERLLGALLRASEEAGLGTTVRCAGGWVRDKLLGRESHDIDVALDNCTGAAFAESVNASLAAAGEDTHRVAVIRSNPEQSKHLETAKMQVLGVEVDFVNLRSETYAQDSRIPTAEFGTPEEDALRRDFTINSLFYNVNASSVEDFSGRGLEDLRRGIIRTPLAPQETLLDDPLRALRAVRFASRYGFTLDAPLAEAAASGTVRTALASKVSRERVGQELRGMLDGPDPLGALELMRDLLLYEVVFEGPPEWRERVPHEHARRCVAACAEALAVVDRLGLELSADDRRGLLLAAALLPWRGLECAGRKGKAQPVAPDIVLRALKFSKREAEFVQRVHEAGPGLRAAMRDAALPGPSEGTAAARVSLGLGLRKLKAAWPVAVVVSSVLCLPEVAAAGEGEASGGDSPSSPGGVASVLPLPGAGGTTDGRVEACRGALDAAKAFGLERCWEDPPLLDGGKVMQALGLQRGGPQVKAGTEAVVRWQLAHPEGTEEECAAWLREAFAGTDDAV